MKYGKMLISWLEEKKLLKDTLLVLGWVLGMIILAGLFWFFTHPMRSRFLANSVNQVLEQKGDYRRVLEPVSMRNIRVYGLGRWYTFTGDTKIFIFTFISGGTFFPCAAVETIDGRVEEFIPLNRHGERVFSHIPPELINIYSRRIEGR